MATLAPLAPEPDEPLALGERRDRPGEPVTLPVAALLRHVMALGSSGSGKTVFCKVLVEEAALRGVPVIAIDPQGDLASLALALPPPLDATDLIEAEESAPGARAGSAGRDDDVDGSWDTASSWRGARAPTAALHDRVDVVVFTPASRRGIPLSADPVQDEGADLSQVGRVRAFSRTAGRIVSLLGYDLDGDEGAGLIAVFDRCLNEMAEEGRPATSLRSVTERLERMTPAEAGRYGRYLVERKIRAACQRAARLDVGARRLLFHDGVPIDIDVLLGRGVGAPPPGKTRVSIIYLNTLETQEDKDFVVATIADRLVSWMLRNPSPTLQALFYIDEVAPYMPPVRKPACKEDLQILFKQARKFGVGCVVATQNPGDVDYKAMGQFGTWALGRLATRQDLKKVEPAVRALMPAASPLLDQVPSLRPGELVLLSPDNFDEPRQLATRWLYSDHRTLDEEAIDLLAGPWRQAFAALERGSGAVRSAGRPASPLELDDTVAASSGSMSVVEPGDEEWEWLVPDEDASAGGPAPAAAPAAAPEAARSSRKPAAAAPGDAAAGPASGRSPRAGEGVLPPSPRAPRRVPAPSRPPRRALPLGAEQPPRGAASGPEERDPSWAWPRDPELAWLRSRETDPAWAGSSSPGAENDGDADPDAVAEVDADAAPEDARAPARAASEDADASGSDSLGSLAPPVSPAAEIDDKLRRLLAVLGGKLSMTAADLAERAGLSERTARAKLKALVASGHAGEFRAERTTRYWSRATGGRPDVGMKGHLLVIQPLIDHGAAEEIGRGMAKGKVLGLIGPGETFIQAQLVHHMLYRVAFQEKVKRPLLGRLIGPSHEERLGSLYLHPLTLDVLLFSADTGIRFATRLPEHASDVADLDGVARFLEVRPGDLTFDEQEWLARRTPALAKKRLRETFAARPGAVTPVFVPLWKLFLRRGAGESYRVETVDALTGRTVEWPEIEE